MMIEQVLERLEHVRQRGNSYRAACPVGHKHRHDTLSLRESDDGAVLLHCFAGCTPAEVLGAIGMKPSDLFPASRGGSAIDRKTRQEWARETGWKSALESLTFEAWMLKQAARDLRVGKRPNIARIDRALTVIEDCRKTLCPPRS